MKRAPRGLYGRTAAMQRGRPVARSGRARWPSLRSHGPRSQYGTNGVDCGWPLVSRNRAMPLSRTKTADDRPRSEPPPASPPTLPPDFPDIPQNPYSELQPPPPPGATPDEVAGVTPELPQREAREVIIKSELRHKNARLREKINSVLEQHPELRDVTDEIALKQGTRVRVGTPFPERIQANLQERARAIIERRPDLEHLFDD